MTQTRRLRHSEVGRSVTQYSPRGESTSSAGHLDVSALTDGQYGPLLLRNAALHTRDQAEWGVLTSAEHIDRSHNVLRAMKESITRTLHTRKADHEDFRALCHQQEDGRVAWVSANAEYEKWRAKHSRLIRRVDAAISEVNKARKDNNRARARNESERRARPVIRKLALAIDRHRSWAVDNDYEPTAADLELWGVLESLAVDVGADGGCVYSLSDMLLYHWTDNR